ncbi:single-stranded-DNA-specific exonuclease RecJ [Fulvivirgaceae bacterium BMA12]|uniref:Single-stranded-DNA-specific exonuclease RecJ n=1 Tax=Agaribacillus aureus TaxID=3051825 RepID=A0ABT8LE07_9BACT|nr:single-stranded-DNA-specific exonuclease RecJ [Fulvivirgaceae bacterium BMA12]
MVNRWDIKEQPPADQIEKLSSEINVNPILSALLLQRGISAFDEAKAYFRPSLEQLHDPFLMKDMDLAVDRINEAIKNNQKMLVYGDYDVDGTTAVATFFGFLRAHHKNIDFYVPDRYTEGYGVSMQGIDYAAQNGIDLIVSLDCGIKAEDKVAYAKAKGIDFIICDHHRPGKSLPGAVAILDPKQSDCTYPFKELSGCGVGFKLLQALCAKNGYDIKSLYNYLDLVAVSIASDIVPITGENRVLAHFGLMKLNRKPSVGLKALIKVAGLEGKLNISSVVFSIGPRINAAGRIAHARAAVELLTTNHGEEAEEAASKINHHNAQRRDFDNSTTQEAFSMIEESEARKNSKSTVLYKKDWHKGVIGIVASRCIDKYYKPTIILTESNNKITGSARSVTGFDVYEAIAACSDLLDQFGGHMYAAGLTLSEDNFAQFEKKFEEVVARTITEEQMIPTVEIDQIIDLEAINQKFFNILRQMSPFGPKNMTPVFVSENVYALDRPKIMKEKHIKFLAGQEGSDSKIEIIGFGFAEYFELINSGMRFKIAYTIEENDFTGVKSLQLYLKDLKFD